MLSQIKLYLFGAMTLVIGVLAFLLQHQKLKAKTKELQSTKKIAQINHDVARILANRNVQEVLNGIDKEISSNNLDRLDD